MFYRQMLGMLSVCFALMYSVILSGAAAGGAVVLKNPYENIDWASVSSYKANLHFHTIYSDGRAEPDELIYAYAESGYSILAIADHDNYFANRGDRRPPRTHETTWPWTRWIEEQPSETWKKGDMETAAFYPDIGENGMLAIRGNELTTDPHIISLFNDCGFPNRSRRVNAEHDHERIGCVAGKGGLAFWAHPAIYVPPHNWADRFGSSFERAIDHFGQFLVEYDCMVGIEFNQRCIADRRSEALQILDTLLQLHYRDHDIFLFGNDDSHLRYVADDSVLTIVFAEDLTAGNVRHALENGHTFVGQRTEKMPVFREISVDESEKTIFLDILNVDRAVWIKDGKEHTEGLSFNYSGLKDSIVRVQIYVDDLTFYSQAFHIGEKP